jgi:chromosome segregation ATPase
MSESTNDTYRNRALALRKHAWQFRARWRMAEMEVRDCIRLVEKRTDQYEECHRALTQTEAERDAARAELARVTAERDDMGHEVLRLRAALARAHDVLDEETLIELSWKEAGRVTNMFRAALAAAPDAGTEGA